MIEIKNLCKTYSLTDGSVEALKDVSLSIPDGDVFGIIGMSGAGKSTLVRCINMLERPTAGSVVIDGKDLTKMTEKELRAERQSITMIFQGFNLLMQKNCLRNVCFPLELAGVKKAEAIKKAQSLLELVGLGDKVVPDVPQNQGKFFFFHSIKPLSERQRRSWVRRRWRVTETRFSEMAKRAAMSDTLSKYQ